MKILPEEIPDDAAPLTEIPLETNYASRNLVEGTNVFVTLLTGKTLVGRCEWVTPTRFTIGSSDPIEVVLVESAKVV